MKTNSVDIVLPTYNGGAYLSKQIESVVGQTFTDWSLLIRDDGSSDATADVIRNYADTDGRICIISDDQGKLGAVQNFSCLLRHTRADYVMLCDQDDVWLQDKIQKSLDHMRKMEKASPGLPILVHSDLRVVDSSLKIIAPSFRKFQCLDPENSGKIGRLLVQNVAVGCTMIMNRSLVKLSLPIPDSALMHDWWIALVACAMGRVGYIDEPTVLYRQHGSNTLGGRRYDMSRILERFHSSAQVLSDLLGTIYQAGDFLKAYGESMDKRDYNTVYRYSTVLRRARIMRLFDIVRYGFYKSGFLRNMATAWALLSLPGSERVLR